MNPKYQIFISSTYEDLKEEREQVMKAVLRMGHIPIGMEMFNAANETQWEMIKRRIEESDYYLVIIAHRYGSVEQESGLSYTEKEYDYANSIGVPTLGFVLSSGASWPGDRRDDNPGKQAALKRFVEKVEGKLRSSWSNKDELASAVSFALNDIVTAHPRVGWVRADQVVHLDAVNEMARLSKENAELREKLETLSKNYNNMIPMPDVQVTLEVLEAKDKWYGFTAVSPQFIGFSPVKLESRRGAWIRLSVSNSGTLATDLRIQLRADASIFDAEDVDAFEKRNSPLTSIAHTTTQANGWYFVEHEEEDQVLSFRGRVNSLRPGQQYILVVPVLREAITGTLADSVVEVDIFPDTGRHIRKSSRVADIMFQSLDGKYEGEGHMQKQPERE